MLRKLEVSTASLATKAASRRSTLAPSSGGLLRRALPPHAAVYRPLAPSSMRTASFFVRGYASQPPGGGTGGGGFPGFSFPMAPQQQKGDALKEYVSV